MSNLIAYFNSKKLRQAWNKRLQAVLWGNTFWTTLEMASTNYIMTKKKAELVIVATFEPKKRLCYR